MTRDSPSHENDDSCDKSCQEHKATEGAERDDGCKVEFGAVG